MVYSIAEAKKQFSTLVKRAAYGGETVTVGSRGKPEAALISTEELRRLQALELERDARLLEEAVRRSAGTVGVQELLEAWQEAHPRETIPVPATRRKRAARKASRRARD